MFSRNISVSLVFTVWKFANFPPTIFCKNSVKLTFSLKSYTVNQFDEKILLWGKISEITTLCLTWKYFVKSFHNILDFVKKLISRDFLCQLRAKFDNFHTVFWCTFQNRYQSTFFFNSSPLANNLQIQFSVKMFLPLLLSSIPRLFITKEGFVVWLTIIALFDLRNPSPNCVGLHKYYE